MKYTKYQALGNDYLVVDPADLKYELNADRIRLICHRNYGPGGDGILLGPLPSEICDFGLRIFNPDGSEAQLSGNGARIFARFLVDGVYTEAYTFTIETIGGPITCTVTPDGRTVSAAVGKVTFQSTEIPVAGPPREVLNERLAVDGRVIEYCAASVGNPHCVVLSEEPTPQIAQELGPLIENEPRFPERTNVQFMRVLDRSNIQIEIWERGAGYTLSSGSSSTAAAATAHKLGLCDSKIAVHMPGGQLDIELDDDFTATMTGPVTRVCSGSIAAEMYSVLI